MIMAKENRPSVLIGITGGIGSGKSTVSRFLSRFMGLPLIDIDGICRQLLTKGQPGLAALRQNIAPAFFGVNGELDRRLLRAAIFTDPDLRAQVDALIHPLARNEMCRQAAEYDERLILADVPLLFEAHWQEGFGGRVVVYADMETCCRRIISRDRIKPEEVARSIAAQMPLSEKALLADHVIDNSGCWLYARLQVVHLARLLTGEYLAG